MKRPFTPRPYQGIATSHLLDLPRSALWAGMGLGKTVSTLTALDTLFMAGEDAPALVLAPLRVARSVWSEEAAKWDHFRQISVMPIVGTEKERLAAMRHDCSVFTVNYDNLVWLVKHWGDRWPYRTVVSDEATRLKSFRLRQGGVRTQALARVAHTKIKKFIELTGTPSPNGLVDLWGQMWFLDGGQRLGRTFTAFRDRWFTQTFDGYGITPRENAQQQIQDALRDLCLTIDAKDWFDIDDPIVSNIYVDLPIRARQLYDDMEKRMFMEIEEHPVEVFGAAARTIKCLQIANGAAYIDDQQNWKEVHDEKLQALEDIIEEAAGAPVLVAYHFKSDLARLRAAFPRARTLDNNPQTLRDWSEGKIPVLFAHPASAGHGLNLQDGGNILVYFGHWWNLEERQQILERIGPVRQKQAGYERPVFVYNIIARDTVDQDVIDRTDEKRTVQEVLLESMKRRQR